MKKFFYLLLLSLFIFIPGVSALDFSEVNENNFHLYVAENTPYNYTGIVVTNYDEYNYCTDCYYAMVTQDPNLYIYSLARIYISKVYIYAYDKTQQCFLNLYKSCVPDHNYFINGDSYTRYSNFATQLYASNILYSTFDIYDNSNNLVFENNFNTVPILYNLSVIIPNGSNFILKDSDNNVITSDSNIYSLESGTYTYELSKSLYHQKTGSIVIEDSDLELSLELDPLLDLSNYSQIFSNYFSYFTGLKKIFILENPFFYLVYGISILAFLFLLIFKRRS